MSWGQGAGRPPPASFLPCLALIPVSKPSQELKPVSGIEFPTELVTEFHSHGFLLSLVNSLCLLQHPLARRVSLLMAGCLGSLWQKVLHGEEEVQQEMGKAKRSHHQHKIVKV